MPLRDVLPDRPRILFVGINPGLRSEACGHHFAGPGNPFWRLLHAARLVPEPIGFADDVRLAEWGIGLTNLCPRATRAASELRPEEYADGWRRLQRKIARVRPRVVVFVGVSLYARVFGHKVSGGPGPKLEVVHGARVFVVPNPSGLNASFPGFEHKLVWMRHLRSYLDALEGAPAPPAP